MSEEKNNNCLIKVFRRISKQGFKYPIQVTILRIYNTYPETDEIICKLILKCDGESREVKVEQGKYRFLARELPLGCNVQSKELDVEVSPLDPTCVILKPGTPLQQLLSGFGGKVKTKKEQRAENAGCLC